MTGKKTEGLIISGFHISTASGIAWFLTAVLNHFIHIWEKTSSTAFGYPDEVKTIANTGTAISISMLIKMQHTQNIHFLPINYWVSEILCYGDVNLDKNI